MTPDELLKKLETLRFKMDLDVTSYCQILGISKSNYYKWKNGITPKGIEDTLRLLNILKEHEK